MRVEVAGRRIFRILTSSQQSGIWSKKQYTRSITNTRKMTTIHTRQIQLTKMHIRKTTPRKKVMNTVSNIFLHTYCTNAFTPHLHFSPLYYPYIPFPLRPAFTRSLNCTSRPFTLLHYTFRWFSLQFTNVLTYYFVTHIKLTSYLFLSQDTFF
jgi:hypothetical protein